MAVATGPTSLVLTKIRGAKAMAAGPPRRAAAPAKAKERKDPPRGRFVVLLPSGSSSTGLGPASPRVFALPTMRSLINGSSPPLPPLPPPPSPATGRLEGRPFAGTPAASGATCFRARWASSPLPATPLELERSWSHTQLSMLSLQHRGAKDVHQHSKQQAYTKKRPRDEEKTDRAGGWVPSSSSVSCSRSPSVPGGRGVDRCVVSAGVTSAFLARSPPFLSPAPGPVAVLLAVWSSGCAMSGPPPPPPIAMGVLRPWAPPGLPGPGAAGEAGGQALGSRPPWPPRPPPPVLAPPGPPAWPWPGAPPPPTP
jgi:hypothetical protein